MMLWKLFVCVFFIIVVRGDVKMMVRVTNTMAVW